MKVPVPQAANAIPDLGLSDFAGVPPRGNVAIAVRCALRLSKLFQLPDDFAERGGCQSTYDAAVARALAYAKGGVDSGERLKELIDATYQMADLTEEVTNYAGYAAAHAVQAVGHAREITGENSGMRAMQLIASTFGACRVLIQSGRSMGTDAGIVAVRADLAALKTVPVAAGIDPTEAGPLGPLWPEGAPAGFR